MMNVVEEQCQNATICLDLFHVVQWATNALDEVRREVWNAARKAGFSDYAKALKGARWALWHNPGNLTSR
jgi:transposase